MKKGFFILVLGCITFFASTLAYAEHNYSGNVNFLYGSTATISSSASAYDWAAPYDLMDMGVNLDFGKKSWPFVISVGYYTSSYDAEMEKEVVVEVNNNQQGDMGAPGDMSDVGDMAPPDMAITLEDNQELVSVPADIDITYSEIRVGIKKIWDTSEAMHPFVDFGVSTFMVNADYDILENDEGAELVSGTIEPDASVGVYVSAGLYYTLFSHVNIGAEVGYSQAKVDEDYLTANLGGLHTGIFLGYHFGLF